MRCIVYGGLMAAMLMNSEIVVQSRDGVHNIVSAASRIVRTQILPVVVHLML